MISVFKLSLSKRKRRPHNSNTHTHTHLLNNKLCVSNQIHYTSKQKMVPLNLSWLCWHEINFDASHFHLSPPSAPFDCPHSPHCTIRIDYMLLLDLFTWNILDNFSSSESRAAVSTYRYITPNIYNFAAIYPFHLLATRKIYLRRKNKFQRRGKKVLNLKKKKKNMCCWEEVMVCVCGRRTAFKRAKLWHFHGSKKPILLAIFYFLREKKRRSRKSVCSGMRCVRGWGGPTKKSPMI